MQPGSIRRENGKLHFEIEERALLASANGDLRVVDPDAFLEFVARNFFTLTHDLRGGKRATWWERWCESLAKAAASTGHGVTDRHVPEPTCGCDPEEHDGG